MTREIPISQEESDKIENLFYTYCSYMSMIEYLASAGLSKDSEIFELKWKEASDIWIKLEKAKKAIEKKYKPIGNWNSYEFNFEKQVVVFE